MPGADLHQKRRVTFVAEVRCRVRGPCPVFLSPFPFRSGRIARPPSLEVRLQPRCLSGAVVETLARCLRRCRKNVFLPLPCPGSSKSAKEVSATSARGKEVPPPKETGRLPPSRPARSFLNPNAGLLEARPTSPNTTRNPPPFAFPCQVPGRPFASYVQRPQQLNAPPLFRCLTNSRPRALCPACRTHGSQEIGITIIKIIKGWQKVLNR